MNKKKGCCDFFRNIFKKNTKPPQNLQSNPIGSTIKTSYEDNTEIGIKNKNDNEESKDKKNNVSERNSICIAESDPNSFFYDKNSALIEVIDKKKALENLQEAYGIIKKDHENPDDNLNNKTNNVKEQFTKVIVGINFKEILAGEESIVISERSEPYLPDFPSD